MRGRTGRWLRLGCPRPMRSSTLYTWSVTEIPACTGWLSAQSAIELQSRRRRGWKESQADRRRDAATSSALLHVHACMDASSGCWCLCVLLLICSLTLSRRHGTYTIHPGIRAVRRPPSSPCFLSWWGRRDGDGESETSHARDRDRHGRITTIRFLLLVRRPPVLLTTRSCARISEASRAMPVSHSCPVPPRPQGNRPTPSETDAARTRGSTTRPTLYCACCHSRRRRSTNKACPRWPCRRHRVRSREPVRFVATGGPTSRGGIGALSHPLAARAPRVKGGARAPAATCPLPLRRRPASDRVVGLAPRRYVLVATLDRPTNDRSRQGSARSGTP